MVFPKLPTGTVQVNFSTLLVTALTTSERLFMFLSEGLKSEGLYRVSGFSDSVEEVKTAFDKGTSSSVFYGFLSEYNMTADVGCFHMFA